MADWRSASADMRSLGIDEYLAALNVLVDGLGGRVDLVGLCQGGWLSLVYAARFPAKVRKLVMAGAPVDLAAQQSGLSAVAEATPLSVFQSLVSSGNGLVIGRNIAKFWGNATDADNIRETLQGSPNRLSGIHAARSHLQELEFLDDRRSGKYYLEVVEKMYSATNSPSEAYSVGAKNRPLAAAASDLSLAGSADDVVAPEQLLAAQRLVERARGALPPGRAVQSPEPVHGKTDA